MIVPGSLRALWGWREITRLALYSVLAPCAPLTAGLACGGSPPRSPAEETAQQPEPAAEDMASAPAEPPASPSAEAASSPNESGSLEPPAAGVARPVHPSGKREVDLDAEDDLDADIAALDATTQSGKAAATRSSDADAKTKTAGLDIVYRVTPKGLVIELEGVHLRPEAKPFKDKNGAHGIELVLRVESFDGRTYWLRKPNEGPLSIAGKVEDKAGKATRFADERVGAGEEVVTSGDPRTFRQRWPGRGQPKLGWGQTVTLEVGLWGLHAESERERPVRRLFEVKMSGGNKPQAVLSPPTLDWGS
jgi:hypothetical protein